MRSASDSVIRLLASRAWATVLGFVVVLGTVLASARFDAAVSAADHLSAAQLRLQGLQSDVRDLGSADPRPDLLWAWAWLESAVGRHGATLAAGTNDEDFRTLTNAVSDAWIGTVSGQTSDTLRAVYELAPAWHRYRPLALRVRDGHCVVLIAVLGSKPRSNEEVSS